MQELILDRLGDGWGEVRLESAGLQFFSMENPAKQIPAATYKVALTPSGRVMAGSLWTCWPKFMLPLLLDVKGREAIRLHAANLRKQLEGCIAFGKDRTNDALVASRAAFEELAKILKFPCWITINDPPKEQP